MNRFITGALGGFLATIPMTMAMVGLWSRLPVKDRYALPPREITEVTIKKISAHATALNDKQMAGLSLAAHFMYGAATGALYPLICREPRQPLLFGASYGVGVWAASYLGWIPAARILTPATQHPTARNRMMIISHVVWGAATVLIAKSLQGAHLIRHCAKIVSED